MSTVYVHKLASGALVTRSSIHSYTHVCVSGNERDGVVSWHTSPFNAANQAEIMSRRGWEPVIIEEINNGERA